MIVVCAVVSACGDGDGDAASGTRGVIERGAGSANQPPIGAGPGPGNVRPDTSANKAPTISGVPSSAVLAGATFTFRPAAIDPDGDTLAFSITNAPRWANFNTLSGRLRGTPSIADIGRYDKIQISVTDGKTTTSLPAFAIDVVATALGTITVSWMPPTERADGSPLLDIGGYKLYWGTTEGSYPNSVLVDPGVTTYVIDGLVPGTYYLVATTLDGAGLESDFSAPVRITIS